MSLAALTTFIMPPSYRSHYSSCTFVCLSVCPVQAGKQKSRKTVIGVDVPRGTSKRNANFQLKRLKVKVIRHKNTNWRHVYLRAADQAQEDPAPTAPLLGLNLVSAPEHETLGNDGRPHLMSALGGDVLFLLNVATGTLFVNRLCRRLP